MPIYIQTGKDRREIPSLRPLLRESLSQRMVMDPTQMDPRDVAMCPWVGWGIGKGITDPRKDISVFGAPEMLRSGLHGELAQGFDGVDPLPLCYDLDRHLLGFGGFVRWVYFAGPSTDVGVLGIDWGPGLRMTSGVATGMLTIAHVARVASKHGIPDKTALVLLNCRMVEPADLTVWRNKHRLLTVRDWRTKGVRWFTRGGKHCPACGNKTFTHAQRCCYRCGVNPNVLWRRDSQCMVVDITLD